MTTADIVMLLTGLAGGLAFFMFGMNVMSSGLEKMAGGKLETMMQKVTSNYWLSLLLGAGVTIAVQSSSAVTVMLIGLVNSGIMAFGSTFGLIMGSNVGTTLTSWLLSLAGLDSGSNPFLMLLQPSYFAPILALIGTGLRMFSKKEKHHDIGAILIGFTILIVGMDLMSDAVGIVEESGQLDGFLTMFSNPFITLIISTIFTGIIQSSAATIGIVQALALSGAITYEMAIPLVLGANIGTCVTALIATLGTEKNAKRVAAIHMSVNVIGTLLFMIGLTIVNTAVPSLPSMKATMFAVALIHTIFNMSISIVLSPFKKPIVRLAELVVPDKKEKEKERTVFLDERLFATPALAVSECKRLAEEMGELTRTAIFSAIELVARYDAEKAAKVRELEGLIDRYEDKLGTYLVRLSGMDLTDADSHEVGRLLHSIGDFERISDHATNIVDTAQEIFDKKIAFSDAARSELSRMTAAIVEIMDYTAEAFATNDLETAAQVEPLEQVIDVMKSTYKERHITRLQEGRCTIELGFVFNDLITNYERVSDHCSNIAVSTIQRNAPKQDAHKYLRNLKNDESGIYAQMYAACEKKYLENL